MRFSNGKYKQNDLKSALTKAQGARDLGVDEPSLT